MDLDLDKASAKNILSELSWVPEPMLQAARDVQNMKNSLNTDVLGKARALASGPNSIVTIAADSGLEPFTKEDQPMVGIDSDDMTYCGMCGGSGSLAGKVVGASADLCDIPSTCDELREIAPDGSDGAFDMKELSFDPWYIVQGSINPASDKALDAAAVRDGLRSFFVAEEMSGVQVTAYPDVPDELMNVSSPSPGSLSVHAFARLSPLFRFRLALLCPSLPCLGCATDSIDGRVLPHAHHRRWLRAASSTPPPCPRPSRAPSPNPTR